MGALLLVAHSDLTLDSTSLSVLFPAMVASLTSEYAIDESLAILVSVFLGQEEPITLPEERIQMLIPVRSPPLLVSYYLQLRYP